MIQRTKSRFGLKPTGLAARHWNKVPCNSLGFCSGKTEERGVAETIGNKAPGDRREVNLLERSEPYKMPTW